MADVDSSSCLRCRHINAGLKVQSDDGDKLSPCYRLMNPCALPGKAYVPTDVEHIANVLTHGMLILPSIAGLIHMLYLARGVIQMTAALIYGFSLVALFSTSTAFHALSYTGYYNKVKEFFHIGDRAVIYIFIASSYSPWLMLKEFNDDWSTTCLYAVWISAVVGITYQYTFHEQYKWLEITLYLFIGIIPSTVIIHIEDTAGLLELAFGGLMYISGVVFFKSDGRIPFAHAIWHFFVFMGAALHYYAVCKHLLGSTEKSHI